METNAVQSMETNAVQSMETNAVQSMETNAAVDGNERSPLLGQQWSLVWSGKGGIVL